MSERYDFGPDYCPTCSVRNGADLCSTRTGRDHPARRHYRLGYDQGRTDTLAAPRDQTEDGLAERILALASKYESLLDHYDRLHIADVLDDLETLLADQPDTTVPPAPAGYPWPKMPSPVEGAERVARIDGCPDFWPDGRHLDPPTASCTCDQPDTTASEEDQR